MVAKKKETVPEVEIKDEPPIPDPAKSSNDRPSFNRRSKHIPVPRMIEKPRASGMYPDSAFVRLQKMNRINEEDELPDLPEPGYLEITTNKPDAPTNKSRHKASRKICCSCLPTYVLLIIEIICLGFAFHIKDECEKESILVIILAITAFFVIITEWLKMWMMRESSPMLEPPNIYKSTVLATNEQLESERLKIHPPFEQAKQFYNRPQVTVADCMVMEDRPSPYDGGGGYRGRMSQQHICDGCIICSFIFLTFIYLIGLVVMIWGLTWLPEKVTKHNDTEACSKQRDTNVLAYVILHLLLTLLRFIFFCGSCTFRGLCFLCRSSTRQTPDVPMVVNYGTNGISLHHKPIPCIVITEDKKKSCHKR